MSIRVEFSGGLEQLFSKKQVTVELESPSTVEWLLGHLKALMTDPRQDLFLQDGLV
jgi:hypothetical protein